MPPRVAIIQRIVTDYRTALFQGLHEKLTGSGVELTVFAGRARTDEAFKDGLDQIAGSRRVVNHYLYGQIYWQNLPTRLASYDLVIVEQATKTLLNYALFTSRYALSRPRRIAYWGHGATLNHASVASAQFKRSMTGAVDHWFAYTCLSRDIVAATGFPDERITVLNNSVDTSAVHAAAVEAQHMGKSALRRQLGLSDSVTAVFCARLTGGKKLDFLLEAADIARRDCPDFQLIVIGDGPERPLVEQFAANRKWITLKGALYGVDKANFLAAADVMVLPSWVGLSILDGFAAGLPVLVAKFCNHSPEIAYLEDGVNGYLTEASPQAYAAALTALYCDPAKLSEMAKAAFASAERYSMSAMIENFTTGVLKALK